MKVNKISHLIKIKYHEGEKFFKWKKFKDTQGKWQVFNKIISYSATQTTTRDILSWKILFSLGTVYLYPVIWVGYLASNYIWKTFSRPFTPLTFSSNLGGKIRSIGPPIRFILTRTWFLSTDKLSIINSLKNKHTNCHCLN